MGISANRVNPFQLVSCAGLQLYCSPVAGFRWYVQLPHPLLIETCPRVAGWCPAGDTYRGNGSRQTLDLDMDRGLGGEVGRLVVVVLSAPFPSPHPAFGFTPSPHHAAPPGDHGHAHVAEPSLHKQRPVEMDSAISASAVSRLIAATLTRLHPSRTQSRWVHGGSGAAVAAVCGPGRWR